MQPHDAIGYFLDDEFHQAAFGAAAKRMQQGSKFGTIYAHGIETRTRILFRKANRADVRMREHRCRNEFIVHLALAVAVEQIHQRHLLTERHRRELHAVDHVAERVDRWHRRLEVFVHLYRTGVIGRDSGAREAECRRVGVATGGVENRIEFVAGTVDEGDELRA